MCRFVIASYSMLFITFIFFAWSKLFSKLSSDILISLGTFYEFFVKISQVVFKSINYNLQTYRQYTLPFVVHSNKKH